MSNYSFTGNGHFGGTNNFLGILGGIGQDWGDGMAAGMKMGTAMQNYSNFINTSPSQVRAQIAQNVAAEGQATGDHYRNYMMNGILSRLAGGLPFTEQQQKLIDGGYIQGINGQGNTGLSGSVSGTPVTTQVNTSPATQVATPTYPSIPGLSLADMQRRQAMINGQGYNTTGVK